MKLSIASAICIIAGIFTGNLAAQQVQQGQAANIPKRPEPSDWEYPTGPYSVVMRIDEALPDHTIYSPSDLSIFPDKDKLPVVVMSGPGCDFDGDSFRPFWTEIASYGYLVIAVGPPVPEGTRAPIFFNKSGDMIKGVDWAFAENAKKGSMYFGKIDTSNIVLMGQSCGGSLVIQLTNDPRITCLAFWNSGALPKAESGDARVNSDGKWATSDPEHIRSQDYAVNMHLPVAYFVGEKDFLRPNSLSDFEAIHNDLPTFYAVRDIPGDAHGGTFREKNGGGFGVAGVAWLNWLTKGDAEAAKMFTGYPCGLEKDPKWVEIRKKNIQ
jgi:dienelactone hydrolase